jgi:arylsulfatase A-like enzyme
MRVPLLIRCPPSIIQPKTVVSGNSSIDIAPTLLAYADQPTPKLNARKFFLAILKGKKITWKDKAL